MATRRVRSTTTRVEVSTDRGVFMISVAAELAEMHPQTLRMYEARGLIEPKRSPKGTRLYSREDVDRLRRIQGMTAELGMNLAGVERVFELESQLASMARKVAALERAEPRIDEGFLPVAIGLAKGGTGLREHHSGGAIRILHQPLLDDHAADRMPDQDGFLRTELLEEILQRAGQCGNAGARKRR